MVAIVDGAAVGLIVGGVYGDGMLYVFEEGA